MSRLSVCLSLLISDKATRLRRLFSVAFAMAVLMHGCAFAYAQHAKPATSSRVDAQELLREQIANERAQADYYQLQADKLRKESTAKKTLTRIPFRSG